jgi:GYF domain 2
VKKYYFVINNQQVGPFSVDLLKPGQISPHTLVWAEGMANWQEASHVSDFKSYFQQAIPPPIPMSLPLVKPSPPPVPLQGAPLSSPVLAIEANLPILTLMEGGFCPITGKHGVDTTITIRKWRWYLIYFSMKKSEIPVSYEGKEIHRKQLSTMWEVLDPLGGFMMYIPLLGGLLLIYLFVVGCTWGLPVWILLDLILGKKILGRGKIRLNAEDLPYLVEE